MHLNLRCLSTSLPILLGALALHSQTSHALGPMQPALNPGCLELAETGSLLTTLSSYDRSRATRDQLREVQLAHRVLCLDNYRPGESATYQNGQRATTRWGHPGATWYYSNGQKITSDAGKASTKFYYPNGQEVTAKSREFGVTWFYPNGKTITAEMGTVGAAWFYPDGKRLTRYAGEADSAWYYADGRRWSASGPVLQHRALRPHCVLGAVLGQQRLPGACTKPSENWREYVDRAAPQLERAPRVSSYSRREETRLSRSEQSVRLGAAAVVGAAAVQAHYSAPRPSMVAPDVSAPRSYSTAIRENFQQCIDWAYKGYDVTWTSADSRTAARKNCKDTDLAVAKLAFPIFDVTWTAADSMNAALKMGRNKVLASRLDILAFAANRYDVTWTSADSMTRAGQRTAKLRVVDEYTLPCLKKEQAIYDRTFTSADAMDKAFSVCGE